MKKTIVILLFLLGGLAARAQFTVSYSAGYGKYGMSDLKKLMPELQRQYQDTYPELDFAVVDNFPGYLNHTLHIGYRLKNLHEVGVTGSFLTTGAKLSYADYSGEILVKLIANAYRIGGYYRFYLSEAAGWNWDPVTFYLGVSPAAVFSKLKSEGHIRIGSEIEHDPNPFKADKLSLSVVPEIGAGYRVLPWLGLHLGVGYDICLLTKLEELGDGKIDWSGVRFRGGVTIGF